MSCVGTALSPMTGGQRCMRQLLFSSMSASLVAEYKAWFSICWEVQTGAGRAGGCAPRPRVHLAWCGSRLPNPPAKRSYGTPRLRSQTLADAGAVSMLSRPTFLHRKLHNNTQGKRPTECGTGRRRSSVTARNRFSDGALVVSTRQADCQTSRRLLA